jgi:hypothetical protein
MKSKLALAWFIVSLILAALLFAQNRQAGKQKQLLEKVQLELEKVNSKGNGTIKELERERMVLRGQLQASENELNGVRAAYQSLQQSTNKATSAPRELATAAPAAAGNANATPNGANFLANMLKNPEMKKVMEQQQRMAMDMMYASLLKKLQLTPDQEKQFKEILLEQQMQNISQAGSIMDQSSTNRAEVIQKIAQDREQRQQEIKQLLGDDKFAQYEDYNQTMGERMLLDQFGKQVELKPDQTEQLLNIMREEKKNAQINAGVMAKDPTADFKALQDPTAAEKMITQQEEVNQRVLERAGQVLSPEQLQKLSPVLQNQIEMQRAGMKMARQMFGGDANAAPVPEQPAR